MTGTGLVQFGGDAETSDPEVPERALELATRHGAIDTVHGQFVVDTRRYGRPVPVTVFRPASSREVWSSPT